MLLTLLAVFAIVAQRAVALVTVPLGPAGASVGTGVVHARVLRVLHVHAVRKVLGQRDVAVVKDQLNEWSPVESQ